MSPYEDYMKLSHELDDELDVLYLLATGLTATDPTNWMLAQINKRLRLILEQTQDTVSFAKTKGGSG